MNSIHNSHSSQVGLSAAPILIARLSSADAPVVCDHADESMTHICAPDEGVRPEPWSTQETAVVPRGWDRIEPDEESSVNVPADVASRIVSIALLSATCARVLLNDGSFMLWSQPDIGVVGIN